MKKQKLQKHLPDLKNKALEMALNDFEVFCNYAGVNKTQLSVCIERSAKKSLQQIANKLQIPKSTVKDICDRCFPSEKPVQK